MTPDLRVTRGAPTDAELAALVAGLVAATQVSDEPEATVSAWTDRRSVMRGDVPRRTGGDAWRWSLRA